MINNPNYIDDLSLAEVKKILTEKGKDKEIGRASCRERVY
jgi:hypothetical protein